MLPASVKSVQEALQLAISEYVNAKPFASVEALKQAGHRNKCVDQFLTKFFEESKDRIQNLIMPGEFTFHKT